LKFTPYFPTSGNFFVAVQDADDTDDREQPFRPCVRTTSRSNQGRYITNNMKKKFLIIGLPILGGLAIAGVGIASAAGMFAGGARLMGFGGGFGDGGGVSAVTPTTWAANQAMTFQNEATALGLSESFIVNGWAQGQSLEQIAAANGISASQYQADMKTYAQSQQKADLDALVAQGTIASAQETQYLAAQAAAQTALQTKMQNASGTWQGGHGGFGRVRSAPATTSGTSSN